LKVLYYIFSFLFGAAIGSFINVLIYRLPREISIVRPNSFCPKCKKPIFWYENIPMISFILLGGKCSKCRQSISWQYPLVEATTAILFLYSFHRFNLSIQLLFYLLYVCILITISSIDFVHQIIPNILSIPGIILGLVFQLINNNIVFGLIGMVFGGGLILLVRVFGGWAYKKEVMGMGDVYLTAMIGAFVGFPQIIPAILIGALSGSIYGIMYLLIMHKNSASPIPFGPFLSIGGLVVALFQTEVLNLLRATGINL